MSSRRSPLVVSFVLMTCLMPLSSRAEPEKLVIGSKTFTESRILAEMMAQLIEAETEIEVERKLGLGGTLLCFSALKSGEIDIYPEYTGTAWAVVLEEERSVSDPLETFLYVQRRYRTEYEIDWLEPFGFNNTYVLTVRKELADRLGLHRISDLVPHGKELRAGVSIEFLNREDGYPGLAKAYGLELAEIRGMDHGLAYDAVNSGAVDIVDAYSTDGKLLKFPVVQLEDDKHFFPPYHAAPNVRMSTLARHPEIRTILAKLAFRIDEQTMQKLNFAVEGDHRGFAEVAREYLESEGLIDPSHSRAGVRVVDRSDFWGLMSSRAGITLDLTLQHLRLTVVAVLLATLFAVPLGIFISRRSRWAQVSLGTTGIIQTIPSLALLAFMIPIPGLGLGASSAIAALFLYALLPILRNTYTGIMEVDPDLIEAARAIGLRDHQILLRVELPLATRTIMAGIRTSTVISVGVATLAAFIGAGGLGEPIITGLQLNDTNLILSGAIPSALLALLVDVILGRLEVWLSPAGT